MKPALLDLDFFEIQALVKQYGEPAYRAKQLFSALHAGKRFDEISNLPKSFIARLAETYESAPVTINRVFQSKDGTQKYLFELTDGNLVEGVLMRYKYGNTLCISTQVGCRMNCAFCASGLDGLVRNLTAGEILGQVIEVNRAELDKPDPQIKVGAERAVTNIVLMGSGEPFDNYDNVTKFLRIVNSQEGICVSERNISLSTCGLAERIKQFAESGFSVTLTISLHAPNDALRSTIMPVNNAFGVEKLIAAAKYYFEKTGRRVVFEYALIGGVNDSIACAKELAKLIGGFPSHVNLIRLNYVKEKRLQPSKKEDTAAFLKQLEDLGVSATLRRTMGADIEGACGQLRRRFGKR